MKRRTLDRFLSRAGISSRTGAEKLVQEGRVSVNGRPALDAGLWIDPDRDRVTVDGKRVHPSPGSRLVLYNKPRGVLVTAHDPEGRPTVAEALPEPFRSEPALKPVGRLDQASAGLLLLTDDTDLANALLDPRLHVKKRYRVKVRPGPQPGDLERLRRGLDIGDSTPTAPAGVEVERTGPKSAVLELVLVEGRNRQIRRMVTAIGAEVEWLVRVQIGPLELGSLAAGEAREATPEEKMALEARLSTGTDR